MKKKILASLLVGSAVVGASLAPLSAQATTTGKTPVTVGFEGGTLPDGDGSKPNVVDPDPTKPNSNFDLLYIPREYSFGKLAISDDLTQPIPNKPDGVEAVGDLEVIGIGDVRGTKEGWHLTAQSTGLAFGTEKLQGNIVVNLVFGSILRYDEVTNTYSSYGTSGETAPTITTPNKWTLELGGDAKLLANAPTGKGQGTWEIGMVNTSLNLTTTANEIKAGNYTGNITWNLVAGPSI
ncbi:WxL domain-containing protein [Enterococcus faecalis]|uniref:WxL domain-containing protein n=1 Tax=Enterococcus faecalis TaxID=1351 RepID=UPI003BA23CEB